MKVWRVRWAIHYQAAAQSPLKMACKQYKQRIFTSESKAVAYRSELIEASKVLAYDLPDAPKVDEVEVHE